MQKRPYTISILALWILGLVFIGIAPPAGMLILAAAVAVNEPRRRSWKRAKGVARERAHEKAIARRVQAYQAI